MVTLYHHYFDHTFSCFFFTETFFNSTTLEELYLDRTSLPINFLQNIGALPALKVLSVGECDLHDTLPAQGELTTLHLPIIKLSMKDTCITILTILR
jgi:Leucine-rich repeat (LRR) protein